MLGMLLWFACVCSQSRINIRSFLVDLLLSRDDDDDDVLKWTGGFLEPVRERGDHVMSRRDFVCGDEPQSSQLSELVSLDMSLSTAESSLTS